jgi:hypothetical protein
MRLLADEEVLLVLVRVLARGRKNKTTHHESCASKNAQLQQNRSSSREVLSIANPKRKTHLHEVVLILDRVTTSQVNGLGEPGSIEFIFRRWHVFLLFGTLLPADGVVIFALLCFFYEGGCSGLKIQCHHQELNSHSVRNTTWPWCDVKGL